MKKTKIVLILLVYMLFTFTGNLNLMQSASAAGISDWTISGFKTEQLTNGIRFKGSGLETLDYAIYTLPLNTEDIILEISPEECELATEVDAWIAVNIMGVPEIFNLEDKASTPGFVARFMNYKGTFRLVLDGYQENIFEGRDSWTLLQKGTQMKIGQKNTFELKLDREDLDFYHLIINNNQLDSGDLALATKSVIFPSGSKYLVVASFTADYDIEGVKPASFVINSVNGKSLGQAANTPAISGSSSSSSSKVGSAGATSSSVTNSQESKLDGTSQDDDSLVDSEDLSGENSEDQESQDPDQEQGISDSSIKDSDGLDTSDSQASSDGMAPSDKGDSKGGKGIYYIIGAVVVAILVAAVLFFFVRKRKK